MDELHSRYQGCLLGLAAGDALGYTVDSKSYDEIRRDYGPGGLLGYDLVNGYAQISSHTQLAAYVTNGLLLGITHGQRTGKMAPFIQYIRFAQQEWGAAQRSRRVPDNARCWVSHVPPLRQRCSTDSYLADTLRREQTGTMEEPINRYCSPAALTAALPVGLFFHPNRMEIPEIGTLAAQAVALTQGDSAACLSGAVLAFAIAGIVQEPDCPMELQLSQAAEAVAGLFGREYPAALELEKQIYYAITLAGSSEFSHPDALNRLRCFTAPQVLSGAVYACLASLGDFDAAMTIAVNHSGRSAAVGALTGALLGARLGKEGLQQFYMDGLEVSPYLLELAEDLAQGCPMEQTSLLFDDAWDSKYTHGEAPELDF